jgi:hypothetical protein
LATVRASKRLEDVIQISVFVSSEFSCNVVREERKHKSFRQLESRGDLNRHPVMFSVHSLSAGPNFARPCSRKQLMILDLSMFFSGHVIPPWLFWGGTRLESFLPSQEHVN